MFKKLYSAGQMVAETRLQKFIWSKTMTPDDKKEATGMLGLALGGMLENIAIGGIVLAGLAVLMLCAAPGGLTVGAFLSLGAVGTALAGVGVFGKGMKDKGDEISGGIIAQAKALRKGIAKEFWNDLRRAKPKSAIFAQDAKPAAADFSAAASGEAGTSPAATPPVPKASALEIK